MLSHMSNERIFTTVISIFLVMISASLHEFGHAYAAYRCGDDTAKRAGRLTLNPFAHIDRFGSIVLPLIMGLMGGPVLAFAKPVPYNPNNLRNPQRDEVIVAFAGPLANLLQASIGAIVCRLLWNYAPALGQSMGDNVVYWVHCFAASYISVNC